MGSASSYWHTIAFQCCASLIIGVVLTFLIAYQCARLSKPYRLEKFSDKPSHKATWGFIATGSFDQIETTREIGLGCRFERIDARQELPESVRIAGMGMRCWGGWPKPAVAVGLDCRNMTILWSAGASVRDTLWPRGEWGPSSLRQQPITFRVDAFGMSIDVVVYGGAVFVLWRGAKAIRSALRRRLGRCGSCGYSRTGLPSSGVCPECGGQQVART